MADASDGAHANLPEAQDRQAGEGIQDLSMSVNGAAGGSPEPSLLHGHSLIAYAARVPIPRSGDGLAH